ncbi:MAG TPA: alkaline phosphatase family protein [Verrucomicrobiae bacterium]|jgi:predicted AlkP superfamily pyrophosphatase or phosphodiesterase|nr:alkaline phosphatase family protein [Verrucomicrobiae bacterium]
MAGGLTSFVYRASQILAMLLLIAVLAALPVTAQKSSVQIAARKNSTKDVSRDSSKPKLVVILVVDQMRGDYADKFQQQWTGGLKRLVDEGAWFHEAAYPYASTETCVGHTTISTGAFPASHGMIGNEWWDREQQKEVTCTADASVKNIAYDGSAAPGGGDPTGSAHASTANSAGDSAVKMLIPAFAEELKFQSAAGTRVVAMSLKARAAITLAGHQADSVTWWDGATGLWQTSSAYPQAPFIAEFVKLHPVTEDYGKTWAPLLPESAYLYDKTAVNPGAPTGYGAEFPHPLRGAPDSKGPDRAFYLQWATSPYAETYLAHMAENVVDKLKLGSGPGIDFLSVSFSSVDYVGHSFGPRSWEVQDELACLDRDLGEFFTHLDKTVGRGKYVVAFSSDHGVAPVPEDLRKTGVDAGRLNVEEVRNRIEQALEPLHYAKPSVSKIDGANVYFTPDTYAKLKSDAHALQAVIDAIQSAPGVARVYQAEEVDDRPATRNPMRDAEAAGFFKSRSGDLLIVPKPYWIWDYSAPGKPGRNGGTSHGTPYFYDQRVPVILMGTGIRRGKYYGPATPGDIAPTLATLCGITLATHDGRTLAEALEGSQSTHGAASSQTRSTSDPNASSDR